MARAKLAKAAAGRPPSLWLLARHDFQQPAQSLEWLVHGLAGAASDNERRRATALIGGVAASLQAMVAGMTLVDRLEGAEQPPAEDVAIRPIVDTEIGELSSLAAHRRIRLNVRKGNTKVKASQAVVAALVRGVLLYAIKQAEGGDVEVALAVADGQAEFRVFFPGVHPATAKSEAAFVELPPIEGSGGRPFVGIGPALLTRAAEALGGGLTLDAPERGRAAVVLRLPAG